MASGSGFEGDVGYVAGEMRKIAAHSRDIARNLERTSTVFVSFEKAANRAEQKMADIGRRMERLNELGDKGGFEKLRRSLRGLAAERGAFRMLDSLDKGISKVASSLAKLGTGIIAETFDFLVSSIKRVYELQERWTRAIGGFNMKIGGMTSGLKQAQRAATAWSSTIRGLTGGDITEGIQLFEEFTLSMSRVVKQGDEMSRFGLQLARGFNLGGAGAGRLASTFEDMGASAGEATSTMSELIDAANLVQIPVNQLAADVVEANTYMARFGKDGAKGFVTAAGYARRFAMSMRELQAATERFDLFDDAATAASKLNSTFGTLINSVDLMLMDDPAQRIEYLRQQFLAQGKTFDVLSVKERRFAAETMGVNDQQLAALLNLKDANISYLDITAKQQAKEATEVQAKKRMEVQLRKTAQTMYAFGAAFDRITIAIAKAIRPLLEVLGLAKAGGKDFASFGQVMESVTQHIIHFFESLAGNDKWQLLMRKLATGMREVAHAVSGFIMSGQAAKWAGELAGAMAKVYDHGRKALLFMIDAGKRLEPVLRFVVDHVKEIAIAWAAWQGLKLAGGVAQNARSMSAMIPKWNSGKVGTGATIAEVSSRMGGRGAGGGGIDWATAKGSPFELDQLSESLGKRRRGGASRGAGAMGLLGAGAGIMTSLGGGNTGEAIGAGVGPAGGTALGMALGGPLGAALGGALGEFVGKRLGASIHALFKPGESALDKSRRELREAMDDAASAAKRQGSVISVLTDRIELADAKRAAMTSRLNSLDERSRKTKGSLNDLSARERSDLQVRIIELQKMGMSSRELDQLFSQSFTPNVRVTDRQLRSVATASANYEAALVKLRDETEKRFSQEKLALESSGLAVGKRSLDLRAKEQEVTLERERKRLKDLQSGQITEDFTRDGKAKDQKGELAEFLSKGQRAWRFDLNKKERDWLIKEFSLQKQRNKVKDAEISLNELREKATTQGMELDKRMFLLQSRHLIQQDTRFLEFQRMAHAGGMKDENAIFAQFMAKNQGEFKSLYGDDFASLISSRPMAAGGVVRGPTRALIGENGPEAVVPLRAIARGRLGRALGLRGGGPANMATGSSGGRREMQVVTSQVIIDGRQVGRAITSVALSSPEA